VQNFIKFILKNIYIMRKAFTNLSSLLIVVLIISPVMLDAQDLSLPTPMKAGGNATSWML